VHPRLFDLYRPWSDGPYADPAAPLAPAAPPAPTDLDLVVFSKDRPAQLELLLRSAKKHFAEWDAIRWSVVLLASDEAYAAGYDRVRALHPEFDYVDESQHPGTPFKELVLSRLGDRACVAFIVDDNVVRAPFSLDTREFAAFRADPEILCLSVRMSPQVAHSYPTDEVTPPPRFEGGRPRTWAWDGLPGGWGYPMSIDFHVFRREEILPLLRAVEFTNPNSLEAALAARPLPGAKMVCLPETPIMNLAVNRVQEVYLNRHAGLHHQAELNARFLGGERLALEPIEAVRPVSTHHEVELEWEPQPAEVGAVVCVAYADEAIERPELLAAFAAAFTAADDATLVLYGPGGDAEALAAGIEPLLEQAGLAGAEAPDLTLLCVAPEEGDRALAGSATAVLTGRAPRPGLASLVHLDTGAAGLLRGFAGLADDPAPDPDLADRAQALAPGLPAEAYERFAADVAAYRALPGAEALAVEDLMPQLADRGVGNPFDGHYLYQDAWAAGRIAERRPGRHVDVGSRVDYVAFLTAVTDVAFVDIRPLEARLEGLESVVGSVLDLPFPDRSLESVSCLHVAEHIGLGRYGDPLDPEGTVKAARELQRVLAPGGELLFAVPVGVPRTCFNAHRIHAPQDVLALFDELELVEHAGVDDACVFARHRSIGDLADQRYACGMFRLRRPLDRPGR
jgi:SAM-dependent methyltransferase